MLTYSGWLIKFLFTLEMRTDCETQFHIEI